MLLNDAFFWLDAFYSAAVVLLLCVFFRLSKLFARTSLDRVNDLCVFIFYGRVCVCVELFISSFLFIQMNRVQMANDCCVSVQLFVIIEIVRGKNDIKQSTQSVCHKRDRWNDQTKLNNIHNLKSTQIMS